MSIRVKTIMDKSPPKRVFRKSSKFLKLLHVFVLFVIAFIIQTTTLSHRYIDRVAVWNLDKFLPTTNLSSHILRTRFQETGDLLIDGSSIIGSNVSQFSNSTQDYIENYIISGGYDSQSSLSQYILWHRSMLSCLQHVSCLKNPPILLWKCPHLDLQLCSGTGDRFRGIISMLAFAMLTKRLFLLDWPSHPVRFHHLIVPASIDWRVPQSVRHSHWPILLDESFFKYGFFVWHNVSGDFLNNVELNTNDSSVMSNTSIYSPRFSKKLWPFLNQIPHLTVFSRAPTTRWILRDPEWKKKYPDLDATRLSERRIQRMLLQAMFKPSKVIEATLESLIYSNSKSGYISIHARTGQDFGENNLKRFSKQLKNEEIAERLLSCASSQMGKTKLPIYFASDSVALKRAVVNISRLKQLEVYYSSIPGYHIVLGNGMRSETRKDDSDVVSGYIGIFVDFFGLAGGRKVISTKSEFSRLAYTYGNSSSLILVNIVDPEINKTCK